MFNLPCQFGCGFLSVPDLQPVACAQHALAHDICSPNFNSEKKVANFDRDTDLPSNHALLTAAGALVLNLGANAMELDSNLLMSAAESSESGNADVGAMELTKKRDGSTNQHGAWVEMYEPNRVMQTVVAPKRFYLTFWRSIAHRLLHRRTRAALPSLKPGPSSQGPESQGPA